MNQQSTYEDFLLSKVKVAEKHGISISRAGLHSSLRPDQMDIIIWCLELGKALVAPDAGCGKTRIGIEVMRILQERFGGKCLIVTELGAADTFVDQDPEVGEGVNLDLFLEYVTNEEGAFASRADIVVTNYERVRMGAFDFSKFTAVWCDEGNYIKNMASGTTDALKFELAKVRYKFIATATPSPNEVLELVNYAHVLGICDRGQILTRFFQRNSTKAGELTLHPQHEQDFWLFVHSWCIAITSPMDLGYDYPGFDLPKINIHWVEVPMSVALDAGIEKDGQSKLFVQSRAGLPEAAKIKRASIGDRIKKTLEIVAEHQDEHFIFWHHLEDERKALNAAFKNIPDYGDIYGQQDLKVREKRVVDFTKGHLKYLATKPELNGVGCNFQKHCWNCVFVGINDSFDQIYQALKRIYRFYQKNEVNVWLLYTPEEYDIVNNLKRKWSEHDIMRDKTREIIKEYGLDHSKYIEEKRRSFKNDRRVYAGTNYTLSVNDCVLELGNIADSSIDMICSSFPFGNHYEYTDKYNDFGHNENNDSFIQQMDFLIPNLLRVLKPGRLCAVHLKNRIHYGSVTGLGFSKLHRFTHMVCDAMEKHGFYALGWHYIPTDVVAENNQTYRLTYGELKKDSTKMGAGIPEEIWIFRKPPTSTANAYADEPVTKNELEYSLSHWQIDADSFWKTSGNRYLTPQELLQWGIDRLQKWWKQFNKNVIYDYEAHVNLLQSLDQNNKLSRTFTTLPLRSNTGFIWNDVNRMRGLNMEQSRRKQQNHICPMPFDEVDRLITLYTNPGETILDPFGGIGTTGVRALKLKRKAYLIELNDLYAKCASAYLQETERENNMPTLFDVIQTPVELDAAS